jgi:hypothetical protein
VVGRLLAVRLGILPGDAGAGGRRVVASLQSDVAACAAGYKTYNWIEGGDIGWAACGVRQVLLEGRLCEVHSWVWLHV